MFSWHSTRDQQTLHFQELKIKLNGDNYAAAIISEKLQEFPKDFKSFTTVESVFRNLSVGAI